MKGIGTEGSLKGKQRDTPRAMVLKGETRRWMQDEDREVMKTWKDKTPCRRAFDCFFLLRKAGNFRLH